MKKQVLPYLLTAFMSMVWQNAYAYDIAVKNADGVTIYYNWNKDKTELGVTYLNEDANSYHGIVVIPESVKYEGKVYSVTDIGVDAFHGNSLTSITIPSSITSIGADAFFCCELTSVHISDLSAWCKISFGDNPLLWAHHLYINGKEITNLEIPNSVTSIGYDAFNGCSGLTSVSIPNSVESIGERAFYNCSGLTSIKVESGNEKYDSRSNCNAIIETSSNILIAGCKNTIIPNSVTSIGSGAFSYCSGLTSVTIPNSVTSIGDDAFTGCTGLTSVTIPNSVTSIGNYAFYGCSGLTSVTIPNSVTSIGISAFHFCSGLTSVIIPNSVTSIGSSAFSGCTGLTSITIPNSVTSIGDYAFDGTEWYNNQPNGLVYAGKVAYKYKGNMPDNTSITIKDGTMRITERAFEYCTGLTSITIPNSVTSIGGSAFSYCSGLTSVTIPNSVTSIGGWAFEGTAWYENQPDGLIYAGKVAYKYKGKMPGNTSIIIKNGTLGIANIAFSYCSGLTSVTIPNSVTSIGESAFGGCSGLTSVTIPNSVTSIGESAFSSCSGLTSVTIPNSVTSIDERAFSGCKGLTTIISEIEKPFEICSDNYRSTFSDDTYIVAELIVPYGTKTAYQNTEGWNKFTMITEAADKDEASFTIDGITYEGSKSAKTVVVKAVDTKQMSVEIPASVSYDGVTYQVTGIADDAFKGSNMAALVWNVEAALPNNAFNNASIGSNFLLYVKQASYAPSSIKNVIANGTASSIVLSDDGGPFYCPQAFTARSISYTHNYSMETGGNGKGWETIALPFDVQRIVHSTRGEVVPFAGYSSASNRKPFWLGNMSASGFKRASSIQANEPYIIAMPNNSKYNNDYNLAGDVTFSADNVQVAKTPTFSGLFLPAFGTVPQSSTVYALNVNNRNVKYSGSYDAGSRFISDLRDVRPFEAYIFDSSTRGVIEINFDDGTTDIEATLFTVDDCQEMTIHSLSGQQVTRTTQRDFGQVWDNLPKGVYIVNGKKKIK